MKMNFHDDFDNQLKELQDEESNLERYLQDNFNSLKNNEILEIKNKLSGIKSAREEINEIITGAFF